MFIVSVLIIVIWLQIPHLATRMATLGKIGEFQPLLEDWTQYAECLEFFFAANGITTAKKKCATFLALVGPTTYKLLRSILALNKLGEVAFNEMVKVLSDHTVQSRRRLPVSHFKFYNRSRKPGESVSMFISQVGDLARFCNFSDSLDAMIRESPGLRDYQRTDSERSLV